METNKRQTKQLTQDAVKCRFFGQYLEQIIAKETKYPNSPTINTTTVLLINELSNYHLELKPLSKITKKDLEKIGFGNIGDKKVSFVFDNYNYNWTSSCGNYGTLILKDIDYLRSKGYALPFMRYSVEDLVSFGWVQLV